MAFRKYFIEGQANDFFFGLIWLLVTVNEKSVIWKGKKYNYSGAYNQQMPWEKEAYQFDRPIAKLVEKDQEEIKEILTEQICKNTTKALKCKYL